MTLIPQERRAALGFDVIGEGARVFAQLFVEKGSGYVPLHRVPHPDGTIELNGNSVLVPGSTGTEIVWRPRAAPIDEIGKLFRGYVEANGWKGSPEALNRLSLL